jgi:hypothetical protein
MAIKINVPNKKVKKEKKVDVNKTSTEKEKKVKSVSIKIGASKIKPKINKEADKKELKNNKETDKDDSIINEDIEKIKEVVNSNEENKKTTIKKVNQNLHLNETPFNKFVLDEKTSASILKNDAVVWDDEWQLYYTNLPLFSKFVKINCASGTLFLGVEFLGVPSIEEPSILLGCSYVKDKENIKEFLSSNYPMEKIIEAINDTIGKEMVIVDSYVSVEDDKILFNADTSDKIYFIDTKTLFIYTTK